MILRIRCVLPLQCSRFFQCVVSEKRFGVRCPAFHEQPYFLSPSKKLALCLPQFARTRRKAVKTKLQVTNFEKHVTWALAKGKKIIFH